MIKRKLLSITGAVALGLWLFSGCWQDGIMPSFDPSVIEEPETPSLSMSRTTWHHASKPAPLGADYVRGKILWHTPRDLVRVEDVWDREAAQGQGVLIPFRMIFRPRHYTTDTTIVGDQLVVDTTATGLKSWAGITCPLDSWASNLHDTTRYFEIRARASGGRMHLEFGRISEDINGDGMAMSEDGITTGGALNGVCEEEEDVGLDGLRDQEEHFYDPLLNPDPNGDNWYFLGDGKCPLPPYQCDNIDWDDESVQYEWLNGTEGNINDPSVQGRPDAESLHPATGFYAINSYYSFVIDFESDSFRVPDSDWPTDVTVERRWWTFRIPFRDTAAMDEIVDEDGDPDWTRITRARVWFEDDTPDNTKWDTVEIVDWRFLQDGIGPYPRPHQGPDSSISIIRDCEFAAGRIFDLVYPGELEPEDSVVEVVVFEARVPAGDMTEVLPAVMYVDPNDTSAYQSERVRAIHVEPVDPAYYRFYNDSDHNRHYVVFPREYGRRDALGAWLKIKRTDDQDTLVVGDLTGDTLILRLLRRPYVGVWTDRSWQLMWRNCYAVPKAVALEDLHLSVWKGLPGAETTSSSRDYQEVGGLRQSYIQVLGLDQYDAHGQKYPDGRVDDRIEIYRPDWGLLIFPHREPFGSDTTFTDSVSNRTQPLADTVPDIYRYTGPQQWEASEYFIRMVTYPPPV